MDIFQNQCSESLGFDSMLAANPINSPLQSTESPTHLSFTSTGYFSSIPPPPPPASTAAAAAAVTNVITLPPIINCGSSLSSSSCISGPNDVLLPSIFVKVPMQINQQYQQQNQSRSNNNNNSSEEIIKCEDKSEPIKRELGDLRALEKGTAMVQLPSLAESYLADDQQEAAAVGAAEEEELHLHCCEFCSFLTMVEESLREHILAKHPTREQVAVEVLSCPGCENKFLQRSSLEVHLEQDHMMARSEMKLLMERRFYCVEETASSEERSTIQQQETVVAVTEPQPVVAPEPNRSRIYIKNVQLLKKPDVIEQENVQQAHQQQQTVQQQQQQQQLQPQPQNGKIFIRNVSLLQNTNFVQNVENVFQNPSGLHESKYSFVVPAPSPNSHSPPISIGEPVSSTPQRSKIFIRNVDILRNPLIPLTPPTIMSTCEMSRTSSSESLYTTPPPPVVSPATSMSSVGTPTMSCNGLNMIILPTPICSSNSSTPPTIVTPPAITVANTDSSQPQPPRKSKIFIKNISVLKQPTIHLKSVDELNLMTIDQLQLQNLLPPTTSNVQSMVESSGLEGTADQQSMEVDSFGNLLDDVPSDLDDFHTAGDSQYQEMQTCDSGSTSVVEQDHYQQEFNNDFIIIEPGNSAENVTYEETPSDNLRIVPPTTELMDHQQLPADPAPPADEPLEQQQYHHQTDEDILFVCAEEIINLDPPAPVEPMPTDQPLQLAPLPPLQQAPQQHQARIYVSDNLMEHHLQNHPSPASSTPPASIMIPDTVSPLSKLEQIKIDPPNDTGGQTFNEVALCEPTLNPIATTSATMVIPVPIGHTAAAESERTRSRGRPKGARQTGITKLKKLYTNLTPMEEGFKCDIGDCGARFRQPNTLTYHKKCHIPAGADLTATDSIRCPECGSLEFRNWNTLHTHLWREHTIDMELYSCNLCNFKTPVLCRLNNTHMKIHSDEKNFICAICDKAFKNNKQLRNHRRSHRDLQASQQQTKEASPELVLEPTKHQTSFSAPVICVKCNIRFSSQKILKNHVESKHALDGTCEASGSSRMKCSICGMVFKTRYLLQSHVAKHSEEKKFKCANCDYSTNDHNAIRRHKMRHNSGGHMYRCCYCDYTSIQSTTYRKHLERMHADVASNLLYKCSRCSFVSISEAKYHLHRAKHESDEVVDAEGGDHEQLPHSTITNESQALPTEPMPEVEEDPDRACESVNSDVMIVEKESSSEPPMDAFSLIPPLTLGDHHHPADGQHPIIRPAGFAHNLSKVDNFYGYPTTAADHYHQQQETQSSSSSLQSQIQQTNAHEAIPSGGCSSSEVTNHQHEFVNNNNNNNNQVVMNANGTMVPLGYGETAHGS